MANEIIRRAKRPISVREILQITKGRLFRGREDQRVTSVRPANNPCVDSICFVDNEKMAKTLMAKDSVVCLTTDDLAPILPPETTVITAEKPKECFTDVIEALFPAKKSIGVIHPTAVIAEDALVGKNVEIGAFTIIGHGVEIGDDTIIDGLASIGANVVIGKDCRIETHVKIEETVMGDHCHFSAGCVIGHIGFGVSEGKGGLIPHVGKVCIGDHVYVGVNTNIDRGMLDNTQIGNHVMIDSICQIGHNVVIGDGTVICSQSGISGSVEIGERNLLGGDVGVKDHVKIGDDNIFAARSGITKDIGNNMIMGGFPAVPIKEFQNQVIVMRKMARDIRNKTKDSGS